MLDIDFKLKLIEWKPEAVKRESDRWAIGFLRKVGAFVRRAAQTMQRTRKTISKPGDPPAAHTRRYKSSIVYEVDEGHKSVAIGPLATAVGESLEFGGISENAKGDRIKVEARPHMRPALEQGIRDIQAKQRDPLPPIWTS